MTLRRALLDAYQTTTYNARPARVHVSGGRKLRRGRPIEPTTATRVRSADRPLRMAGPFHDRRPNHWGRIQSRPRCATRPVLQPRAEGCRIGIGLLPRRRHVSTRPARRRRRGRRHRGTRLQHRKGPLRPATIGSYQCHFHRSQPRNVRLHVAWPLRRRLLRRPVVSPAQTVGTPDAAQRRQRCDLFEHALLPRKLCVAQSRCLRGANWYEMGF